MASERPAAKKVLKKAKMNKEEEEKRKSRHTLPVSLEDEELFPRSLNSLQKRGDDQTQVDQHVDVPAFDGMFAELSRIW